MYLPGVGCYLVDASACLTTLSVKEQAMIVKAFPAVQGDLWKEAA